MHFVYLAVRIFPYWALPLAVVIFQLGTFYHRRRNKLRWACGAAIGFLGLMTLLWFIFGGYMHSDQWVRTVLGG
jgi:drug/metabolite transporter (DMT)-like permease